MDLDENLLFMSNFYLIYTSEDVCGAAAAAATAAVTAAAAAAATIAGATCLAMVRLVSVFRPLPRENLLRRAKQKEPSDSWNDDEREYIYS